MDHADITDNQRKKMERNTGNAITRAEEVVVDTGGKEWRFEVDPNGKYVKKQTEQAKAQ